MANRLFGLLVVGLSLGLTACGGDSLTIPPTTGTLEITTATAGSDADPDGYTVQVDAQQPQTIGPTDTLRVSDLAAGSHSIVLTGQAANCSISENPRTVNIVVGETARAAFEVTCGATTGALLITSQTNGPSPDADGYIISVDGIDSGVILANASVTLGNLAPGSHVIGLGGIAANCHMEGDNLRAVTIAPGATASVAFVVTCVDPPPSVGVLRVTTNTTGADPDANGYAYSVDGGANQPIGVNGDVSLPNIAVGSHTVVLSNVAANCTVAGGTSQAVTVTAGATTTAAFSITCTAIPPSVGTVRITTTTSGPDQDGDGYAFAIDGGASQPIGVNGDISLSNISPGSHTVRLTGVAGNCTVDDDSKDVTVTAGATATVAFSITCTAIPPAVGSIHVTTTTAGPEQDPDGYTVTVDGASQTIGSNGEFTFTNISTGSHTVQLSGVAGNCTVDDDSQGVTVSAGATSQVTFSINCTSTAPSASKSSVSVSPDNMAAGAGSSTVTVTVKDAAGNLLSGVSVTPASSDGSDVFTPISATTDQSGVATFTFSSTAAGNKTISATADGVPLNDTAVITVYRRVATVQITGDTPEPSNPGEAITVTFTVTGEGGGTPTGTVEIYSFSEAGVACTAPVTLVDGQGSCTLTFNGSGDKLIDASYSGDSQFLDSFDTEPHTVN